MIDNQFIQKEIAISAVMQECNCSRVVAVAYLHKEEWDIDNAVMSYNTDMKATQG